MAMALFNLDSCYHASMPFNPRRLFAYLLLLLLPLQTLAAGAMAACAMENGHAVATGHILEDCDDPTMMHAPLANSEIQQDHDLPTSATPCGMSGSCLALAPIAILPDHRGLRMEPASGPIAFMESFYLSPVPEGLQRPPQST